MKKVKLNLPLGSGLLIFSITQIISHTENIPHILNNFLLISALVLVFWGVLLIVRSPEMKNSKLRQWKLRLIGRGQR